VSFNFVLQYWCINIPDHIISADLNDNNVILQRRSAITNQIYNVLCYFSQLDKLKLLKDCCSSLYGTILYDVDNSCVQSVLVFMVL